MSAADVFLSSPPRPVKINSYALSSSPNLPPLNEIFSNTSKHPSRRSRSHAAAIPDDAPSTFTSAAILLREAPEIDIETEKITHSPPRKSNPSGAGKKKAPTPEAISVPTEATILIDSSPGDKPWQKFKNKKPTSQGEKQAVQKACITKSNTKGKPREKTETVSRHFAPKESAAKYVQKGSDRGKTVLELEDQATSGPSCSEPALRRRSDWTPPPANNPILPELESDNQELLSSIERLPKSKDVFQTLVEDYGRKDTLPCVVSNKLQQVDIITKRKLIELVPTGNEIGQFPRETSPPKIVNAKKKTRTITELATAPYMLTTEPALDLVGPATKESLLNYFDSDGAVKALVEHQTAVMSQKKEKPKESKPSAKPKRKKKAGTANNPILLSPNSALKQTSNQDFVFGTSSQLVREESPTTLRDLQLAMQASNQVDSDPFADSDSQGLWHAGARDTDGELMKADEFEIEDLPLLLGLRKQSQHSREEFVDINDVLKSSGVDESAAPAPQPNSHFIESQVVSSAQPPKPEDQGNTESQCAAAASDPRPDFESFSDAQLSRQIASYGFKPVKKRQAMIALLDQCWNSKSSGTSIIQSRSISTSSSVSASKRKQQTATTGPENPPKRRGRPRKNSTAETPSATTSTSKETNLKRPRGRQKKASPKPVEIADSDLDDSVISTSSKASSPDRDRIFSSPPAVDLSISDEVDMSLTLSPTGQQADLFRHITKAVTSAPRSRDPSQPSWHEKMLLYDPIVLEDLAAWLNAGALSGAGYDGEVSPFDVKKWCESKSVICLWRQNLNGKERKRY
ncbi:hypothetical protein M434DRAFT_399521 [Hypoxylon sp. CO27-5]|nr:hypothetical protein M434DRAFT_399521 [Hypoxylon sp. CO27-5]